MGTVISSRVGRGRFQAPRVPRLRPHVAIQTFLWQMTTSKAEGDTVVLKTVQCSVNGAHDICIAEVTLMCGTVAARSLQIGQSETRAHCFFLEFFA